MNTPTFFTTAAAFRAWLEINFAKELELSVGFYKVGSGRPSMGWAESVEEALCFGWIDGVRKRIDGDSYQIRFTPRKSSSIWSAINIAKVNQLRAQGRMRPSGLQAFSHRKEAKSEVYAYEQEITAQFSADELRVFKQDKKSWKYFDECPPSYKKVLLHWITTAKKAETRASRLATLVEACAAGKRLR